MKVCGAAKMHIYKMLFSFCIKPAHQFADDDFLRQAKERQHFVHFI